MVESYNLDDPNGLTLLTRTRTNLVSLDFLDTLNSMFWGWILDTDTCWKMNEKLYILATFCKLHDSTWTFGIYIQGNIKPVNTNITKEIRKSLTRSRFHSMIIRLRSESYVLSHYLPSKSVFFKKKLIPFIKCSISGRVENYINCILHFICRFWIDSKTIFSKISCDCYQLAQHERIVELPMLFFQKPKHFIIYYLSIKKVTGRSKW